MRTPKRIGLSLLDAEFKDLVNASAKIFPITQEDVDTDYNPQGYEYGRVDNHIYRWIEDAWEYIIADDVDIVWEDIRNKPVAYLPITHAHTEDEVINLDKYTKSEVDIKLLDKADTDHNHDDRYYDKPTIDNKFTTHIHDERYYLKEAVDTLLENKSDINHIHDGRYYTKGEVDSKVSGRVSTATFNTHINDTVSHVTPEEKSVWYSKSRIDVGATPPSDESMWFEEIL